MGRREATAIFSEWALKGKDEGMERGHAASVQEMLQLAKIPRNEPYSAIDVGCGNGWVCRKIADDPMCQNVEGVDGSATMIEKAKETDPNGSYSHGNLPEWKPAERVDFIHSMEFLYYLKDPHSMLNMFHDTWLKSGGMMVAGVDHYLENEDSLSWPDALDVHMTTMSEAQWHEAMLGAGFVDVRMHRVGLKDGFVGTLVMIGRKQ